MNRRLRIAAITANFPNSVDPYLAIYIYYAIRALQRRADVQVYCVTPSYPRYFLGPRWRAYRRVDPNFALPGIRVEYLHYPALPVVTRLINGRMAARCLAPRLRAAPPDLILAFWIYPEGEGAVRVGEALGVPVIVQALGSDLRRIADPFSALGVRNTLRRASFVLTVSEDLRRRAIALGAAADKVRAVPNGCDAAVFHLADRAAARADLGIAADSRLVLYVGRLDPVKGIGDLLEAAARLVPADPRLRIVCIGTGVEDARLRARAACDDLAGRVDFIGQRNPAEVARWLAAADLLCLPSFSEGCPNVVIEALACGRPVVATPVGGTPELVDDSCGVLTPSGNPVALAEALVRALDREWDERKLAARHGRSWEVVADETLEVCESLVDAKPTQ